VFVLVNYLLEIIMIVYVGFEFEGVDPNSEQADMIMHDITMSCETMRVAFDAQECWVDDAVQSNKE
jgi:hypothetical protein